MLFSFIKVSLINTKATAAAEKEGTELLHSDPARKPYKIVYLYLPGKYADTELLSVYIPDRELPLTIVQVTEIYVQYSMFLPIFSVKTRIMDYFSIIVQFRIILL